MLTKPQKNRDTRPEDCPAAWFVVLERARRINNPALEARARRELDRLGVKLTFHAKAVGHA